MAGYIIIGSESLDSRGEIEEHCKSCLVHTISGITPFLSGAGCHITGNEVTECGISALEIVVTVLLRNLRTLDLLCTEFLDILHLLGNPDTSVIAEGLTHQSQLGLLVTVHGNTCGVNLGEAGICEVSALLVAVPCG